MNTTNNSHERKRFYVLDIIRGVAVLLMILAHTVYFFHNRTNPFLVSLENIGNTLAFTMFLVVSGAVTYIAYFKDGCCEPHRRKRLFHRALVLLSSYYILALTIIAPQISTTQGIGKWKLILDVILFRNTPSYTEFIAPFIFFSFLVAILPKLIGFISKSIAWAISVSVYFYVSGLILYSLKVPQFIEPWKALLAGSEGYYRFPIFQYLPIFILGISWGFWLTKTKDLKHKREISELLFTISLVGIVSSILTGWFAGKPFELLSLRWPPSVPFLLIGTAFTFGLATLLYWTKQLRKLPITRDIFLIFGQNAYGLFWTHIFLLNLYGVSGGTKIGSTLIFIFLFFLITILSLALATFIPFNFKFTLNFFKGEHDEQEEMIKESPIYRVGDELYEETRQEVSKFKKFFFPKHTGETKRERLIKKRHFLGGSILVIVFALLAGLTISEEIASFIQRKQTPTWYSDEYGYKVTTHINNQENFSDIPKNQTLTITLDHKKLVTDKKAQANGSDIKLVWNSSGDYKDVIFWTENDWDLNNTKIAFILPEKIKSGQENNSLEIYYGNALAKKEYSDKKNGKIWEYKYDANTGKEEKHEFFLTSSRNWALKYPTRKSEPLTFELETDETLRENPSLEILGTKESITLSKNEDNMWIGSLPLDKIEPGAYYAQATVTKENGDEIKSRKAGFYISYPVYVTWTIDWEGYDVSNSYLEAMANISNKYQMPMTQLYNPRNIMTRTISEERKKYISNWVRQRRDKNNEEIGMHIHWFKDLVEASGVEYKNTHNWGDSGDGYGSLPSNYSQEELEKIIDYSMSVFKENGFENPLSYRAGGWFANLDLLKALDNIGFKIDSSGRTNYNFGSKNSKGYWDLSEAQSPYHPSKTNQNKELESNLKLWEIPNNGSDSYWFSAEEMISRFHKNYSGGYTKNPIQVTYLSHPHWFDAREQNKIKKVLDNTNHYLYNQDNGPVVYATLETIYREWLKGE